MGGRGARLLSQSARVTPLIGGVGTASEHRRLHVIHVLPCHRESLGDAVSLGSVTSGANHGGSLCGDVLAAPRDYGPQFPAPSQVSPPPQSAPTGKFGWLGTPC